MTPRNQGPLYTCLVFAAVLLWSVCPSPDVESAADGTTAGGIPQIGKFVMPSNPSLPGRKGPPRSKIRENQETVEITDDFLARILSPDESSVTLPLPDAGPAHGRVEWLDRDENGLLLIQGEITRPEKGRFMFQRQTREGKAGSLVGYIHFDENDTAYQVRPIAANGGPVLVGTTVHEVLCRAYGAPPDTPQQSDEVPPDYPPDYPVPADGNGVMQLEGLPGAVAVVYLDFDGEERNFESWGYINARASEATNSEIYEVWEGVCEDYQPFDINITTVREVYDSAPPGRRMHVVVTPTDTAAPGAGGVAYVGSFNWTGEMVCWSFFGAGKNAVEVISHEVGHTLGLSHDGRVSPAETYYAGHNGWAPIMGVGYYRTLSQWSKGEYDGASNPQDDLAIMVSANNEVAYRDDDHGATRAAASWLDIRSTGAVFNKGTIETSDDVDSFRFSTSGGTVTFNIDPVSFNPNLDIKAEILDPDGTVVASRNPENSLNVRFVEFELTAGDYLLRISGTGKGDLSSGYSDYASLGAYTVSGSVKGGDHAEHFTIEENARSGQSVGVVQPRLRHDGASLSFAVVSGNRKSLFEIDPASGVLSVAHGTTLDYETLSTRWDDPANVELLVTITDELGIASELIRTVVTVVDVNESPILPAPEAVTVAENLAIGTLLTRLQATDPDRFDFVSYEIVSGNDSGTFGIDASTGEISVAGRLDFEIMPFHVLTIRVIDHLSPANAVVVPLVIGLLGIPEDYAPGSIVRTFYQSIEGADVADLTSNAAFPGRPDLEVMLDSFDGGASAGDYYGSTVRGYVIAPVTGDYTFWLSSDDAGELRISPDADPEGAMLRATVPGYTQPNQWTKYPGQKSDPIPLVAGQIYYIEARQKEVAGGDHVQVAWQGPGIATREIIPGRWLIPHGRDYQPWADDQELTVRELAATGQSLGRVQFNEPDCGQQVSGYAIVSGNETGLFGIDELSSEISIADGSGLLAGSTHVIGISATDSGHFPMTGTATVAVQVVGLDEDLHAWWRLDESSGRTVFDSSGNNRHGALAGGIVRSFRGPTNPALELNGVDTHLDLSAGSGLSGDTPFSFLTWIKLPASHSDDAVLIQQQGSGTSGDIGRFSVGVLGDGRIGFSVSGQDAEAAGTDFQFDITSSVRVNDGNWHHLACVRNAETGRIFIDGVERASGSARVRMLDPGYAMVIGYDNRGGASYLAAEIDDLRLYGEALGSQQVLKLADPPPFVRWQLAKFGRDAGEPRVSGAMVDLDHDGLSNLLEFALGTNPNEADASGVRHEWVQTAGTRFLRLVIEKNPQAMDLRFVVESTSDPADPAAWSSVDTHVEQDTPERLVVRDTRGGDRRFLRLRVTRSDDPLSED